MNQLNLLLCNVLLSRLWQRWRTGIESSVVPGSGGIAFVGDSITHNGRWDLLFPGVATRNFGVSGERTDQVLSRLAPIVSVSPTKLFLLIGTNDIFVGRPVGEIASNIEQILNNLSAALPSCKLFLQTVLPRASKYAARIRDLNSHLKDISARSGITLIDLYPAFADGSGVIVGSVTNDSLHLLGPGYALWRDLLAPYVLDRN